MSPLISALQDDLQARRRQQLYRQRRLLDGDGGTAARWQGRELLLFCSNDYLGLANHPQLVEAMRDAACQYGVGAGGAHLVSGHRGPHHQLELELAEFTGRDRALLFSTGYMANLGVMSALSGRGRSVWQDRLNHASLLDGSRCAGARLWRYPHRDLTLLEQRLQRDGNGSAGINRGAGIVATDSVFSMDGDHAPLAALAALTTRHGAWLMVDDAHGFGVLGPQGRGSVAAQRLDSAQVPILMATLGKAVGTFGAFVAGDEALIETLVQKARSYIYTTAMPPAVAAATRVALRLVREGDERRAHLGALIARFRAGAAQLGLPLGESDTPIQPLLLGQAGKAVDAAAALLDLGIVVAAIRPPTVPEGSSRLRITLSAAHSGEQVDRLLDALDRVLRKD